MPTDEIKTPFKDYVVPKPSVGGDWGGVKDGVDIPGGRKGTGGIMPEVTMVPVEGAPAPGTSLGAEVFSKIANTDSQLIKK